MALGLAVVTLLSRWPYRARMLYNWDAVQFALALREFDVAKHQPHPPGYLLYVALGRLFNASLGRSDARLRRARHALQRRHHRGCLRLARAALRSRHRRWWPRRCSRSARSSGSTARWASPMPAKRSPRRWSPLRLRRLGGSARHLYGARWPSGLTGGIRQSVLLLLLPLWLGCALRGVRFRGVRIALPARSWWSPCSPGSCRWSGSPAVPPPISPPPRSSTARSCFPTSVLGGSLDVTLAQVRYLLESTLIGLGPLGLVALALPVYVAPRGLGARPSSSSRVDAVPRGSSIRWCTSGRRATC